MYITNRAFESNFAKIVITEFFFCCVKFLIFFYLYLPVLVEKERSSYIKIFFFSNYRFKKFRFTDYNHGDP